MAKKVTYIMGNSPSQNFSDGAETAPVSTFWHIQAPRSSKRTLCGAVIESGHVTTKKRPKDGVRARTVCNFCERIADGRDPVFDPISASKSSRKPEDVGTRAKPVVYARRGEMVA